MFVSFVFILFLTVGGFGLTYFFAREASVLWRAAAAHVSGSVVFGLVIFLLACFFGFSQTTVLLALFLSLLPLLTFLGKDLRARFKDEWRAAKANLEAADAGKFLRFAYYAFFLALFWFFFERAMLETANGIFTGASQNLGDLPFHLGAIFSFTEANNFPPENPSFALAKFSYPFVADLVAASFVEIGARAREAMLVQNVALAFSLLVVLERFVFKLTGSRAAGKLAPALLFFSGGFGFLWFFNDLMQSEKSLFAFLKHLPADYTIGEKFRWGNSLVTLFITQRSLLLGMPLTIIVLQKLWQTFSNAECGLRIAELKTDEQRTTNNEPQTTNNEPQTTNDKQQTTNNEQSFLSHLTVGLFAGALALVHVHSLAVLFVVTAALFFFNIGKWREWISFGAGAAIVAVPELVWAMTGSATRLSEFVDWHFGWDKADANFFAFWAKNTGLFIPLLAAGIFLLLKQRKARSDENGERENAARHDSFSSFPAVLAFYLPFAFLFALANAVKLAPWEWDNIKVLIYWFVGSLPFAAFALVWLWRKNFVFKLIAAACFAVLTFSGALDVWRVASRQINYQVFDKDAVKIAAQIKQSAAPTALFLNAPTYNSAVVLTGRRSLMRYVGHLASYGIDYAEREADLKRIYAGDGAADILLRKYGIEYVLISPEETNSLAVNAEYFQKFPVAAESEKAIVYKVK